MRLIMGVLSMIEAGYSRVGGCGCVGQQEVEEIATRRDWSKLCSDVLQSVFELLTFTDFLRAKAACSAWRSASVRCIPKQDPFPWLIMFPWVEHNKSSSCLLFSPEDYKVYRMRDPGNDFVDTECLASFESWFLFLDSQATLYILNLLTQERIHLPPIESLNGQLDIKRKNTHIWDRYMLVLRRPGEPHSEERYADIRAVFWIDETTKDYLVVWTLRERCLAFCRKGDDGWREIPTPESEWKIPGCRDMVYKNNKLYVYSYRNDIRIFDISGDFPRETKESSYVPPFSSTIGPEICCKVYIAVTSSGDVLMIEKAMEASDYKTSFFFVHKINAEGTDWERIESLGSEALILDQRITVPAKDIKGIKENSIYFKHDSTRNSYSVSMGKQGDIGVFNIAAWEIERFEQCESLCRSSKYALWFFPGLEHK